MGFRIEIVGNTGKVSVDQDATINRAQEFRDALIRAVEQTDKIVVDLSDLQSIDLTCLQLLCSLHKSAIDRDKKIALEGNSLGTLLTTIDSAGFPQRCAALPKDGHAQCLWARSR